MKETKFSFEVLHLTLNKFLNSLLSSNTFKNTKQLKTYFYTYTE